MDFRTQNAIIHDGSVKEIVKSWHSKDRGFAQLLSTGAGNVVNDPSGIRRGRSGHHRPRAKMTGDVLPRPCRSDPFADALLTHFWSWRSVMAACRKWCQRVPKSANRRSDPQWGDVLPEPNEPPAHAFPDRSRFEASRSRSGFIPFSGLGAQRNEFRSRTD
jgi:hypothetical protein